MVVEVDKPAHLLYLLLAAAFVQQNFQVKIELFHAQTLPRHLSKHYFAHFPLLEQHFHILLNKHQYILHHD